MENSSELYEACWDILVEHADARNGLRGFNKISFVSSYLETHYPATEWRFQGSLGFGGKFWRINGGLSVTCYTEDLNPERDAIIKKVNALLAEITPPEGVHGPPKPLSE